MLPKGSTIPEEDSFHFPGGLKDYVTSEIGERATIVPQPFAGEAKSESNGSAGGKVEWAVWWPADEEGFVRSYCNTVPTAEGGTHESGFRSALLRGLKRYAELTGNRKGSLITINEEGMYDAGVRYEDLDNSEEVIGKGLCGQSNSDSILLGSDTFLKEKGIVVAVIPVINSFRDPYPSFIINIHICRIVEHG
jgi:hypothetical protein